MAARGGSKKKSTIYLERPLAVPARLAFRSWAENTLLHPDQVRKRVGQRLVEFTWLANDAPNSIVELQFVPNGANACVLKVRHSKIADEVACKVLEQRWEEEIEALSAHALQRQEVPTLEIQVLPGPNRSPRGNN